MIDYDGAMVAWWDELTQDHRHRWGEAWQRGRAADDLVRETLPNRRFEEPEPTGWVYRTAPWKDLHAHQYGAAYEFLPGFKEFLYNCCEDEYPRA